VTLRGEEETGERRPLALSTGQKKIPNKPLLNIKLLPQQTGATRRCLRPRARETSVIPPKYHKSEFPYNAEMLRFIHYS